MSINNNTTSYQGVVSPQFYLSSMPPPSAGNIAWSVCLAIVGLLTIVFNSLTITAFSQPRLRRPPHYLLISLACADIMVGSMSIPIYITIMLNAVRITLKRRGVFWFFDFLPGLASIFTLGAVSLERLFAIGWPILHRVTSPKMYFAFIAIPWILALMVASLPLFDMYRLLPQGLMFTVVTTSYCSPVVLTIITYIILWLKVRLERSSDVSGADRTVREKDKRLAITLVIATVIFVFTGLPYPIMLSIVNLCRPCLFKRFQLLSYLSSVSKFLHLSNSFLNFVVYILRIAEFRAAITRLVCRRNFSTRVDVASSRHRISKIKSSENTLVGQVSHN